MGIWIEFRCENMDSEDAYTVVGGSRCFSHDSRGPKGMAQRDTVHEAARLLARLAKHARATGWMRMQAGWICPHCAEAICAKAVIAKTEDTQ